MRTALRTSQGLRVFRPSVPAPSKARRIARSTRLYSTRPGEKGYDESTVQEAPADDTASDEDAQVDAVLKGGSGAYQAKRDREAGRPSSGADTSNKDPAGKGAKGPLGPTSGDSPSSTA